MITSTFDTSRNVILLKISGDISVSELVSEYDTIFTHKEFHPNMHAIWDLSSLNLTRVAISDVRRLPNELRKYMERRGNSYKAALVLGRATDYQLMRLYLGILKMIGTNIKFKLHRSLDEAYRWIAE